MTLQSQPGPPVTLVLLAYNSKPYLEDAVKGALAQDYGSLEIIMSDDASADGSFEDMQQMAAGYRGPHRILLNRNDSNLGVGGNVNKAVGMASGEWIGLGTGGFLTVASCLFSLRGIAARLGGANRWVALICRLPGGRLACGLPAGPST